MTYIQAEQDLDELVNHKVRKRVAKKVMKDIHQQVGEIEQQVVVEKKAANILLPFLVLLAAILVSLFSFWSDAMRLFSGLIS